MGVPKAKTKMTRSKWSKKARPNTKSHDLKTSQKVTVMNRFGTSDIGKYASTYMSRDNAAVPEMTEVSVKNHPDIVATENDVTSLDVSRESLDIPKSNRLFDGNTGHLSDKQLADKTDKFKYAENMGHVSMIQVVSFDKDYLDSQNMLKDDEVDDSKLRYAIQRSMSSLAEQAGFSELEYVAAIHGNTDHPHVHIAMIETDDMSTGRLAERESIDSPQKGKTPAAIRYDKQNHVENTVERGMLRQSELDYFRQEIDFNLSKMNTLAPVVDKSRKRTYVNTLKIDALEHAKNNDEFVNKFVETVDAINQTPIERTPELDERVENLSKVLLSGTVIDLKDNLQERRKFVSHEQFKNNFESQLSESYSHELSDVERKEFESLELDESKYTDFVLTPDQFSDKNKVSSILKTSYSKQYCKFVNNPSMSTINGLELSDKYNLENEDVNYTDIHKELITKTNASIFEMLNDAVNEKLENKELTDVLRTVVEKSSFDNSAKSSFEEKLYQAGHQVISLDDKLVTPLSDLSKLAIPDKAPNSIKQARNFIQDVQVDNITALMHMSQNEEVDFADKRAVIENSELTQRQILGEGDLSKSGQALCSALAVEFETTGRFKRLNNLSDDEKTDLIKDYKVQTTAKMVTSKKIAEDLEHEASFSETEHWQSWRYQLSDLMTNLSDDYQTKLEYIDNVEKVTQEPDLKQQELEADIMLSQEIWRKGLDDGLTADEIKAKVEDSKELSSQDKLATALSMRLNNLNNQIQKDTLDVHQLNENFKTVIDYQANTKISDMLDNEIVHAQLIEYPTTVDLEGLTNESSIDLDVYRDKIIIGQVEVSQDVEFSVENLSKIAETYDETADKVIYEFNQNSRLDFVNLKSQQEILENHLRDQVVETAQTQDNQFETQKTIKKAKQKDEGRLR